MTFYWSLLKFLPQRRKELTKSNMDSFVSNFLDLKPSFCFHQILICRIFEELFKKEILMLWFFVPTIVIDHCYKINFNLFIKLPDLKPSFSFITWPIRSDAKTWGFASILTMKCLAPSDNILPPNGAKHISHFVL